MESRVRWRKNGQVGHRDVQGLYLRLRVALPELRGDAVMQVRVAAGQPWGPWENWTRKNTQAFVFSKTAMDFLFCESQTFKCLDYMCLAQDYHPPERVTPCGNPNRVFT